MELSLGLENEVGSIEPGKPANFPVLADNPVTLGASKFKEIRVWGTVKEGGANAAHLRPGERIEIGRPSVQKDDESLYRNNSEQLDWSRTVFVRRRRDSAGWLSSGQLCLRTMKTALRWTDPRGALLVFPCGAT